jgi:hypothetical protein
VEDGIPCEVIEKKNLLIESICGVKGDERRVVQSGFHPLRADKPLLGA